MMAIKSEAQSYLELLYNWCSVPFVADKPEFTRKEFVLKVYLSLKFCKRFSKNDVSFSQPVITTRKMHEFML